MKSEAQRNALLGEDASFIRDGRLFRLRAAAVILHGGAVLMAANRKSPYLYSVGGGVHMGESVEDALLREVYEETGLRLRPLRLLCVHQNFFHETGPLGDNDWHELAFYFLMDYRGEPLPGADSRCITGAAESLCWVPLAQYADKPAYPLFFKDLEEMLKSPAPLMLTSRE